MISLLFYNSYFLNRLNDFFWHTQYNYLQLIDIKPIVQLLEIPVQNVKFFQLSPGEYFISTVKIAFYTGILLTSPFLLSQLTFFVIPGLNAGEKKLILPLLIGSTVLFFIMLIYISYFLHQKERGESCLKE